MKREQRKTITLETNGSKVIAEQAKGGGIEIRQDSDLIFLLREDAVALSNILKELTNETIERR